MRRKQKKITIRAILPPNKVETPKPVYNRKIKHKKGGLTCENLV